MATQSERRAATRQRLLAVATERFATDGYENTPTERILDGAGVSRGAMYHHFSSKRELFEAVFVQMSTEAVDRAVRHGESGATPLASLVDACLAWLRVVQEPEIASILIGQGPQVLGWERARELEGVSSLGVMTRALERAVASGEIDVVSVPLAARLVNAMLAEAALAAINGTPPTSTDDLERAVRQFIEGLGSASTVDIDPR